jgi:AGCS family alanine or glycine:cation symporter
LQAVYSVVEQINAVAWGPFTVLLLVGTGLYLTLRLKFIQVLKLWLSIQIFSGINKRESKLGELSHFKALCVALSATIGNGNIAGVATAITLGGPGAVFWMWVTAVVGMATKYASATLSLIYRSYSPQSGYSGGPMYYIEKGLGPKWRPMAQFFAFCTILAAFGTGNLVESNSVADSMEFTFRDLFGYAATDTNITAVKLAVGGVYAVLVWAVIVGGIKRIGQIASAVVPFMFLFYIISALVVIILHIEAVPAAFALILHGAFHGTAAAGGFAGAGVMAAIQFGVARGVFSNEAGLGTAPIAHASAQTEEPVREGLVAMSGPFIDTLIVCTMTALVIITTGAWDSGKSGSELTTYAFNLAVPDLGKAAVTMTLLFFSFSSVIGWSYYGDRSVGYLFGEANIKRFRYFYAALLPFGAIMQLELVWALCDIANALMAIPNLIAVLLLSPIVVRRTKWYFAKEPFK